MKLNNYIDKLNLNVKKKFQDYLEKRLTKSEITEIERHAKLEKSFFVKR